MKMFYVRDDEFRRVWHCKVCDKFDYLDLEKTEHDCPYCEDEED